MTRVTFPCALGRAIQARRERSGLTRTQLAYALRSHRQVVKIVETGERWLNIETVANYARVLGCRTSELIAEAERMCEVAK